jgi:hypothetical protein
MFPSTKEIAMKFLFGLMAIALTACATNYGEYSFWSDGGFTETELQPNLFNVRFRGNEFTSIERTSEFAMLRASELCIGRDLPFMEIFNVSDEERVSGYVPGSSTTNANATLVGNSVFANSSTIYNPGTTLFSPESGLTAQCIPSESETSWDARFLENSLKTKYDISE